MKQKLMELIVDEGCDWHWAKTLAECLIKNGIEPVRHRQWVPRYENLFAPDEVAERTLVGYKCPVWQRDRYARKRHYKGCFQLPLLSLWRQNGGLLGFEKKRQAKRGQ